MRLKNLRWIVLLMSLALVALVLFQYRWVNDTLRANAQQFDKQVIQAMNETVTVLEEIEAYETTLRQLEYFVSQDDCCAEQRVISVADTLRNKTIVAQQGIHIYRSDVEVLRKKEQEMAVLKQELHHQRIKLNNILGDTLVEARVQANSFVFFNQSSDTLPQIVEQEMPDDGQNQVFHIVIETQGEEKEVPLAQRLDADLIDSTLQVSLLNQGIDIPFQFGVMDLAKNTVAATNTSEATPHHLLSSPYQVAMYRRDLLKRQPAMLSMTFPQKNAYMIRKVVLTLASSILLVGVILFCFVYAVRTILKQKKLSEVKNDFINNMTHEFKTPVATVGLAVEALQDVTLGDLPEMRTRYLQIIRDENNRLGMQVEKVLQIATLDRKELKLKIEKIDVHAVIRQALDKINLQVAKREGQILTHLEAASSEVEADPLHLSNIIYNLLDNANKYSPEEPQIDIATRSQPDGLWVTVADQGIGMTREVVNRIFDKFYRVPTGNVHNVKGFGLGLAYVKTMVEAHHGKIKVTSQPDQGSIFEIFIPYAHG
ncbi:MAG: HAMP domain-containing sensor histidine kinase [Bacteroidota bacterium]